MSLRAASILLAEDDALLRVLLARLLTSAGFTVLLASDGHEALNLAREPSRSIDVLLTDFHMPGMDGVALAKAVRRDRPDTKVLLVSGEAAERIPGASVASASLRKPFPPRQLILTLKALLGNRNQVNGSVSA